jgi:hypothetical protein
MLYAGGMSLADGFWGRNNPENYPKKGQKGAKISYFIYIIA